MTRINLVPPSELMDQHLFAEFREIKMVPASLQRSILARGVTGVLARIPKEFTLNTGHVYFFYDKGRYLRQRYRAICQELKRRGIQYNPDALFDPEGLMCQSPWNGDYCPTRKALAVVRARISQRVAMKPHWYRFYGKRCLEKDL